MNYRISSLNPKDVEDMPCPLPPRFLSKFEKEVDSWFSEKSFCSKLAYTTYAATTLAYGSAMILGMLLASTQVIPPGSFLVGETIVTILYIASTIWTFLQMSK